MGLGDLANEQGWAAWYSLISGGSGVALFYVLSGYLLTRIAISELRQRSSFSGKQFFKRRALRLFPLYFFSIAVLLVLQLCGLVKIAKSSYFYAGIYAYNMVPVNQYSANLGPYHTLATEEQFYLVFGLLFSWLGFTIVRSGFRRFTIPLFFAILLLISVAVRPLFRWAKAIYFVDRWTVSAMAPILVGVLAAFAFESDFWNRFERSSGRLRPYTLLISLFAVLYLSQVLVSNVLVLSVGFACLIHALSMNQDSITSRILSNKILLYLGTISYGLYVWGAVIIGTGPSSMLIKNPILAFACVILAAAISYKFVETPFLKLKRSNAK